LNSAGVANALANPTLELRDMQWPPLTIQRNWKEHQQAAIEATGLSPQHDLEAAILATLLPGSYTAIAAARTAAWASG